MNIVNEIHVVGAAIKDGSKYLAGQRSEKMSTPLKWEFMGGKVEEGESHHQALVRELREELGIIIEVGPFITSGSITKGGKNIILHVYEAKIVSGLPKPFEHEQIKWLEPEEMKGLDWAEPDVPAVKQIIKLSKMR